MYICNIPLDVVNQQFAGHSGLHAMMMNHLISIMYIYVCTAMVTMLSAIWIGL